MISVLYDDTEAIQWRRGAGFGSEVVLRREMNWACAHGPAFGYVSYLILVLVLVLMMVRSGISMEKLVEDEELFCWLNWQTVEVAILIMSSCSAAGMMKPRNLTEKERRSATMGLSQ